MRWKKVQDLLKAQDLDVLLAYADDRFTYGAAYARYFGNLPVAFEPVLVLFAPGEAPHLLTGPETIGYASEVGSIPEIRVLREFAAENEDYPFTRLVPLRDAVSECAGREVRRIGLAGKALMGAEVYEAIHRAFPGAEFVKSDPALDGMRGVKSPAELEVIRYAYHLANLGMEAAIRAVRPGVTEREIAAEAEYVMRKNGGEGTGIDSIVVSGPNTRHILGRTTTRQVAGNDLVVITLAPRYEGYHGACARCVIVGDPGEKVVESVKAGIHAQKTCGALLMPGKVGRKVEAVGRRIMAEAGYGENFLYSGLHSVGVIEFEPPILGPSSDAVLEENMVISIDIPLFEADIYGSRTEDGYLITAGGAERLTTEQHLIIK
jgi:Xaa-Pro aminopeptidase